MARGPRSAQPSFIVVDGFYPDGEKVREAALALDFVQREKRNSEKDEGYNGFKAPLSKPAKKRLMDRLAGLVGVEAVTFDYAKVGDYKALTRRQFERKTSVVHIDLHDWSGVLSLSPPRKEPSFTSFWYHPEIGLDGFHDLEKTLRVCQAKDCSLRDLCDVLDRDTADLSKWVETTRIQHVFNRLILFRGNMFHSSSEGFGTRVENAKLTQTFFFDVPRQVRRKRS